MFETKTYDAILADMLARVPDGVDKREGSLVFNALAPAAAELQQAYIELETYYNETFADQASRENLIKRCAERGISPDPATKAVMHGVFNVDVALGSRYTGGGYIFQAIEKISLGNFKLEAEAEDKGSGANNAIGQIIPVEYNAALTSASITEVLIPGDDEEGTEALRTRYFESFDSQAFGGNKADYKARTNALAGVGGTKVSRTPGGGGTVGVVIIASDYTVPSGALIAAVQTALDPTVNQGEGLGLAPIGHVVTVTGISETTINIVTTITYAPGWNWTALEPYAIQVVDQYFLDLRQGWEGETALIVRISEIESRLLDLAGVVDITGTTLNGAAVNVVLGSNAVPKRGSISG